MIKTRDILSCAVGIEIGLAVSLICCRPKESLRGEAHLSSLAQAADAEADGLRLECRNDDESIRTSETDWKDGQGPLRRKFLRVRVYNDSQHTVRECKIILRRVTEITPDGPLPTDHEGPSYLVWSGDQSANEAGMVIGRNANPEVADLFYTVSRSTGGEIHMKDEFYGSFLRFGRLYEFEVIATASHMKAVRKIIRVQFGPTWDDFEVLNNRRG